MTTTQRLVLDLPSEVFAKIEHAAEQKHRSIQEEAAHLLARAVPEDEFLPARLRAALANLATLDDTALWKAARRRASTRSVGLWRALSAKRDAEGLTDGDERRLDDLEERFHEITLIRAEAALLLRDRGHDIAPLTSGR